MNATPENIKAIFLEAVENYPPDQWDTFLKKACADDAESQARIKVLLQAHLGEDSLLDAPAALATIPTTDRPLAEERPDVKIGPYKLLQQIGEGGMGTVFLAEQQEPVRRVVALKIIKPGMDTRQVIARFEAERQALALMDHPNIARVFDGGTTECGHPYFVMELVTGVPITTYCDEHHLTPDQRLELFIPVCQAVQHAHQKGIIHRDLKPTNVLVAIYDGKPVPKVIDFGVAKATGPQLTERTVYTEVGQVVGTLEYMSPEQAELNEHDVDTRSDVYSLGVLLYELLTGTTPFEKKRVKSSALIEILRIIREEEPQRPSTRLSATDELPSIAANRGLEPKKLSGQVRGELDWIVMKCLEKDRSRRYETANGLALDLARYLADEPVVACPPSAVYRFRKFARRNRGFLVATSLLATTLVLGAGISIWQAIRATEATATAQTKQAEAVTQATTAKAIADLLQQMLGSANPDSAKGAEYTVRELLDDFSAGLGDQLKDQPEAEASIRATIGNAYRRLGLTEQAEPHLQTALELRRRIFGPEHVSVAQSLIDIAKNVHETYNWVPAEKAAREALAIHERLNLRNEATIEILATLQLILNGQHKYKEADAVGQQALDIAAQQSDHNAEVANVLHRMSWVAHAQGEFEKAERLARESVDLHRRLHGDNHPETAWGLHQLAAALQKQQKFAEAEQCCREAIAIFRRYYGGSHRSFDFAYTLLAQLLSAQGKPPEAIDRERLEQAILSAQRAPKNPEAWVQQARAHAGLGEWSGVDACFSKLVDLAGLSAGESKLRIAGAFSQLGQLLNDGGRIERAESAYRFALSLREPLLRDARPAIRLAQGHDFQSLAKVHRQQNKNDEAAAALRNAIEIIEPPAADTPEERNRLVDIGHTLWELAGLLSAEGRGDEAENTYSEALTFFKSLAAAFPQEMYYRQEVAATYRELSEVLVAAGRTEEAVDCLERAIALYTVLSAEAPGNWVYRSELAHTCLRLANHRKGAGQIQEAEELYGEAIRVRQGVVAESPTSDQRIALAFSYVDQGLLYRDTQRLEQAEEVFRIALDIYNKLITESPLPPSVPRRLASASHDLARILQATGRTPEAEQLCRQAALKCRNALSRNERIFAGSDLQADRTGLANSYESLGQLLNEMGRFEESAEAYSEAIHIWKELADDIPRETSYAARQGKVLVLLGKLYRQQSRNDEAEVAIHNAIEIIEPLATDTPEEQNQRVEIGHTLWQVADFQFSKGRFDDALATHRRALKLFQDLAIRDPRNRYYRQEVAASHRWYSGLLIAAGRVEEAADGFRQASALYLALLQEQSNEFYRAELAHTSIALGTALRISGRSSEAEEAIQRARLIFAQLEAENPTENHRRWLGEADFALGVLFGKTEKPASAAKAYRQAKANLQNLVADLPSDENRRRLLEMCETLGSLIAELGEWADACREFEQAVELNAGPAVWYQLALARLGAKDSAGYRQTCARIIERFAKSENGPDADLLVWACALIPEAVSDYADLLAWGERLVTAEPGNFTRANAHGALLYRTGRFQEALDRLSAARAAYAAGDQQRTTIAYNDYFLAMTHQRLGLVAEARDSLKKSTGPTDPPGKSESPGTPIVPWNRRLTLELLRLEAQTLIEEAAKPASK